MTALGKEVDTPATGAQEEHPSQTSPKFLETAKIIRELGETERVLVVCPLRNMLDDARKEMAKLSVPLAILRGSPIPIVFSS